MSRWVRAADERPRETGLYMVRRRTYGRRTVEDMCRYAVSPGTPGGGYWMKPRGKWGFAPTDTVEEWLREDAGND